MHGLQACLFKYITVAAFRILSVVKMPLKGEVGGHALNAHGNNIVDHGIVFLNFYGNPVLRATVFKLVVEMTRDEPAWEVLVIITDEQLKLGQASTVSHDSLTACST